MIDLYYFGSNSISGGKGVSLFFFIQVPSCIIISLITMQSLPYNNITLLTLPNNIFVDIARYSSASVITSVVCTCKLIHGIDELVAKRSIPCNEATTFIFAMATADEKDDIAEYVLSGELRHYNIDGNSAETFDTFCERYMEYLCHPTWFVPRPQLFLDTWCEFDLVNISRSDSYRLRANRYFAVFKVTGQFECSATMVLPSLVVDRHWCHNNVDERALLVEIRHIAYYFLQMSTRSEAAQLLKEILTEESVDLDANYILGIMHLNRDKLFRNIKVAGSARKKRASRTTEVLRRQRQHK